MTQGYGTHDKSTFTCHSKVYPRAIPKGVTTLPTIIFQGGKLLNLWGCISGTVCMEAHPPKKQCCGIGFFRVQRGPMFVFIFSDMVFVFFSKLSTTGCPGEINYTEIPKSVQPSNFINIQ